MLLVVGRIGRAHGLRGEVLVDVRTDEPEARMAPGAVLLTDPSTAGPLTVADGRVHSGRLLLHFAGVADRTAAEALRGVLLLAEVDPEARPDDDDEWYDHQLVGLDAVRADGTPLGEVREVLHLPGHDVLAVTTSDGREVLVPFVTEIVPEVDVAANRLVVTPPPGLLEDLEEG
ncbi:MAG TPA: ribosome maturation factor RimM [Actinomycetes bacterium]